MSASQAIPAVDTTYGAYLISTLVGVMLQGTIFHQTYRYVKLFPNDLRYIKLWVASVVFVEVINTLFTMHASYFYMVTNIFNVAVLTEKPVWSISWTAAPGCASALLVEIFFGRRLWLVGRQFRPIVAFALLLDVSFFACFLALDIIGATARTNDEFFKHSYFSTIGAGLIGSGDLMVTSCLIYVLRTSRTGIRSTNSQLDLLIRYAVGTGFLICVLNVLILTFSIKWPDNWIYTGLTTIITKMYANALLVSLNARRSEVDEGELKPEDFMGHFDTDIIGGIPSADNATGREGWNDHRPYYWAVHP
ncbi:hypothetical protein L226DRAFT_390396 [Lentinus tigrinus ALCF2SS1-7]|uniref:uncharacterized protein n=1 Tax=Lentinus tigrinus ALCF2SS1-7 TaxID=1328758 RepID=UPI001165E50B|nr:hypothetical protein L226DRAFT_390396 [Lentinus tigrinus ALCF2SS1-7]